MDNTNKQELTHIKVENAKFIITPSGAFIASKQLAPSIIWALLPNRYETKDGMPEVHIELTQYIDTKLISDILYNSLNYDLYNIVRDKFKDNSISLIKVNEK